MADNSTFIAGIAQGAFKEALDGVPPWATEKTAGDIVEWLKKSYGKQSALLAQAIKCCGGGTGPGSPEAKKVADEMGRLARTLHDQNDEAAKALRLDKQKRDADRQSLLGGRKLQNLGEKVNYVMSGLAIAGVKVSGVMSNYLDVYESLYASGLNVMNGNNSTVDGFRALQQTVALTGLRLAVLQQVAEKYTSSINAAGFQKFAKASGAAAEKLREFGYSSEQSIELVGSLMEAETGYSSLRGKSADEIATHAVRLGADFDRLSKVMGISRQQMLENLKTTARSSDSTLVAARWGEKAALNVSTALAAFPEGARNAMLKFASAADPVFTQVYKDLQGVGMGDVADRYAAIATQLRTIDPKEVPALWKQAALNISDSAVTGIADQMANQNPAAQGALDAITAFKQAGNIVAEASKEQSDAARDTAASIAGLRTEVEKSRAIPELMFAPMIAQVDAVTSGLKLFNTAVYAGTQAIDAEVRSWIGTGVVVAGFIGGLVLARGALSTFASLFGAESATATAATNGLGGSLMSLVKPLALFAASFAAMLGVVAGVDAIAGKLGAGGKPIDTNQDDANWNRMTALQKAESGLARGIEKIGSLLFMDNIANESAAARIRDETEYFAKRDKSAIQDKVVPTTISVPTAPMASTINSPSSISTPQPKADSTAGVLPSNGSRTDGPAIPKPGANADINNLLSYQGSVLERILLSTNDLVSVNKDILRYARNNV